MSTLRCLANKESPQLPPPGQTHYSTLVFTYEWPTVDTPTKSAATGEPWGGLTARLAELAELLAAGLITAQEHTAARKAALGIA